MKKGKTHRGYSLIEFIGKYGNACSIQKSSIATEVCIWLAIDDADPLIMASDAIRLGLDNKGETTGHVKYDFPEEVHLKTRMHLSRDQVKELIPILKKFVKLCIPKNVK